LFGNTGTALATYLNSPEFCMICFGKPETDGDGDSARTLKLIKHHIKYSPEEIIWVHYRCHQKIHDTDSPLTQWTQYAEEDKKQFYKNKVNEYFFNFEER